MTRTNCAGGAARSLAEIQKEGEGYGLWNRALERRMQVEAEAALAVLLAEWGADPEVPSTGEQQSRAVVSERVAPHEKPTRRKAEKPNLERQKDHTICKERTATVTRSKRKSGGLAGRAASFAIRCAADCICRAFKVLGTLARV